MEFNDNPIKKEQHCHFKYIVEWLQKVKNKQFLNITFQLYFQQCGKRQEWKGSRRQGESLKFMDSLGR